AFFNAVPNVEKESAVRLQDAPRFAVPSNFVGKKHRAELTGYNIECPVFERQRQCIGLLPFDVCVSGLPCLRMIEHRLVQIGGDYTRVRERGGKCSGHRSSACGGFLHKMWSRCWHTLRKIACVGVAYKWNEQPVV